MNLFSQGQGYQNPFASGANPFSAPSDTAQADTGNPNQGGYGQPSPYGSNPPGYQQPPAGNQFPAQGNPFGGGGQQNPNQGDPFGGSGQQQNPYGGGQQQNPYGGGQQQNPYGGGQQQNPYGGGQQQVPGQGDPFGGGQQQAPGQGFPYGSGQQQNPYGGVPQQPQGNPYDPYQQQQYPGGQNQFQDSTQGQDDNMRGQFGRRAGGNLSSTNQLSKTIPAFPIKEPKSQSFSAEFAFNGLVGIGLLYHRRNDANSFYDFGLGGGSDGFTAGARYRSKLTSLHEKAFWAVGASYSLGSLGIYVPVIDRESRKWVPLKTGPILRAQLIVGITYVFAEDFVLMPIAGYSHVLSDKTWEAKKDADYTDDAAKMYDSFFGSGPILGLSIGKTF